MCVCVRAHDEYICRYIIPVAGTALFERERMCVLVCVHIMSIFIYQSQALRCSLEKLERELDSMTTRRRRVPSLQVCVWLPKNQQDMRA